jgi:hypothetical protein
MGNIKNFYGSGLGNRLIDTCNYPREITNYLSAEYDFIMEQLKNFEVLIEVGCMQGRCLEQAVKANKFYIGIDIVEQYIEEAILRANSLSIDPDKYTFLCLSATNLHNVLDLTKPGKFRRKEALIVFPFNSFGNIENIDEVLLSLNKSGIDFFISTYKTDRFTTNVRRKYYHKCNYINIQESSESSGVRFTSDEGLNTIAYSKSWLSSRFSDKGMQVQAIELDMVGIGYVSLKLKA